MNFGVMLIGYLFGLVTSIVTIFAQKFIDRVGKLKIYAQISADEKNHINFGLSTYENELIFELPIKFEIFNTSDSNRIIRDAHVKVYKNNREAFQARQVHQITKTNENASRKITYLKDYGDIDNSYSFLIQSRSLQRENCLFMFRMNKDDRDKFQFDEIRFCYFNEQDKLIELNVKRDIDCSKEKFDFDDTWFLLQ